MAEHVRLADIASDGGVTLVAASADLYGHPVDVLFDHKLTDAQKRALLAAWASDARAVENAPNLRQLESGAVVELDDILSALSRLDGVVATRETYSRAHPRRRLPRRADFWRRRRDHDDDDPSPCPAAAYPVRGALLLDCG